MPTTIRLTWHEATQRWKKKYKGKVYYFRFGNGKSDLDGYRQAWNAWEQKKAELDAGSLEVRTVRSRIEGLLQNEKFEDELLSLLLEEKQGNSERRNFLSGMIEKHKLPVEMPQPTGDPSTFFGVLADFANDVELKVKSGVRSVARPRTIKAHSAHLRNILGNLPIAELNESSVSKVYYAVTSNPEFGIGYAEEIFSTFRQFVNWADINNRLDHRPKNLLSKEWVFIDGKTKNKPKTPKQVFTKEEIDTLLASTNDRMKLWIMLALNCGFNNVDIGDLTPGEVDWTEGRIIRKRSKTKHLDRTPIVNYKLWDETFRLLKLIGHRKGLVCRTKNGNPVQSRDKRSDCVGNTFITLRDRLGINKRFMDLRKTGNSKLNTVGKFRQWRDLFLGHASQTVTEVSYDVDNPEPIPDFDEAVIWLGEQFGFKTERKA